MVKMFSRWQARGACEWNTALPYLCPPTSRGLKMREASHWGWLISWIMFSECKIGRSPISHMASCRGLTVKWFYHSYIINTDLLMLRYYIYYIMAITTKKIPLHLPNPTTSWKTDMCLQINEEWALPSPWGVMWGHFEMRRFYHIWSIWRPAHSACSVGEPYYQTCV